MSLTPGHRLGPYEVIAPLGSGGMGEVFRARDSRLGRDVAVKVLPAAFAADPERLARFEREARLLASLSHQNIAGIHGLEELDGHRHLILELVEGETLAARIARGPLPIDEALDVGRQIAAGLDAAHEAGIVHRDLKPGNVMLTPAGDVKVLDFGLARGGGSAGSSTDQGLSASPTMTYAATMAGVILGTAAYMSPEQARGRPVDRRTDIWSFGCVLYECLTAQSLFIGETISDTIAKILEREPDWKLLPEKTPLRVRELLRRCLEKDARKRQRDAGDIKIEIDEILAAGLTSSGTMATPAGSAISIGRANSPRLAWGIAALSLLAAAAALVVPRLTPPAPPPPPIRTLIPSPPGAFIGGAVPADAAYSPDGTMIVFAASDSLDRRHLWLRPLGALEAKLIPMTEVGDDGLPFWSPDSRRIGFFAGGKLKTISLDGGSPQTVCDAPDGRGGTWNSNGVILFSPTSGGPLQRVAASGGKPETALPLDAPAGETAQRFPRFLPDGSHFTFASLPARDGEIGTWIGQLGSSERRLLISATSSAVVIPPSRVVFTRGQSLMAQRCSPSSWKLQGEPVSIGDSPTNLRTTGTNPVSSSDRGDIVYPTSNPRLLHLEWMSPSGKSLGRLRVPEANWFLPSLSPDDRLVAMLRGGESRETNLWIVDPARGTATPISTEGNLTALPHWTPDGREIVYAANRGGRQDFYARRTTGSYDERLVYEDKNLFKSPEAISPDGRWLLFSTLNPATQRDLWYVPLNGGEAKPILAGPGEQWRASFSPDGRWLAYDSDESGRQEIYVTSFPDAATKFQVSTGGGSNPRWIAKTWEIGYPTPTGRAMRATVTPGPTLDIAEPREIGDFSTNFWGGDITSDGQRFLALRANESTIGTSLTLLTNWSSLLEE